MIWWLSFYWELHIPKYIIKVEWKEKSWRKLYKGKISSSNMEYDLYENTTDSKLGGGKKNDGYKDLKSKFIWVRKLHMVIYFNIPLTDLKKKRKEKL